MNAVYPSLKSAANASLLLANSTVFSSLNLSLIRKSN